MLARTVAHTVHVDAMLASMTPQQFDEWLAEYDDRPWDGAWIPKQDDEPNDDPLSLKAMRSMTGV